MKDGNVPLAYVNVGYVVAAFAIVKNVFVAYVKDGKVFEAYVNGT